MKKLYRFLTSFGKTVGRSSYDNVEKADMKGMSWFHFNNGFKCFAINMENAFRKFYKEHNRHTDFGEIKDFIDARHTLRSL